ncbi:hypothetical protein ACTQ13_05295 [Parafannyhessea sp. LCP21S3_E6]|uniref:hypothetical protein n=1 Tax=Parafannyhessea sp. LCP21S3_E6 TaxID=3438796 RepID=UPI003F9DE9D5
MFTTGDSKEACARRRQEMLAFLQAVDVPLDTSYLRRGSWEWFDDLGQVVALCMTKEPYACEVAHGEGDWRALLGLTVSIVTSVMKTAADEEVSFLEMVMLAVYAASCKAYDDLYQGKVPPELARRMAGANRRMYETGKELRRFSQEVEAFEGFECDGPDRAVPGDGAGVDAGEKGEGPDR